MNKKILLGTVLGFTLIIVLFVSIFSIKTRYNKLVISETKWNNIIDKRSVNNDINLENITFNDYNLMIDENNSTIYYSTIDNLSKFNPLVDYVSKDNKVKIAFNQSLTHDNIIQNKEINILIYNKKYYRIYKLVITDLPILSIEYNINNNESKKIIPSKFTFFDNHIDSLRRVVKSDGKFIELEKDNKYSFSLIMESLGNNRRDNDISIFGMQKKNEYVLNKVNTKYDDKNCIELFINNEYKGIYSLNHIERRKKIINEK